MFAETQVCLFHFLFLMVFIRKVFCHLCCFWYNNYVDGLLRKSGVGCFWGSVFAGAFYDAEARAKSW